ncbi:MAG: hypothetical protein RLZZ292_648 [Bacteroidota bacterium]|jgi:microcystin-dependent protein
MNTADFFTATNGFPLEADNTLGFMQADYQSAIRALARMAGVNNLILSGVEINNGIVSDGWIFYNNDVVFFQGGLLSTDFIIEEQIIQKANKNGNLYDRYTFRKAKFGSGSNSVPFSTLKRIESLEGILQKLGYTLFENEVIVSGLSVTNNGSSIVVTAGTIWINGNFLNVSAYSGVFPVYLDDKGVYQTVQPATGTYIAFNPYTSQYLKNVYKRAITLQGEILMQTALSDRFDGTGLGLGEMLGFALANGNNGTYDMRGRMAIGYDERSSDPSNGIWDSNYNTIGNLGGELAHVLTIAEMPEHNHTGNQGGTTLPNQWGLLRHTSVGEAKTIAGVDANGSGNEPDLVTPPLDIPHQGSDNAHENRPPYLVLAYIQRL